MHNIIYCQLEPFISRSNFKLSIQIINFSTAFKTNTIKLQNQYKKNILNPNQDSHPELRIL